jgi:hypothetical protein
VIILRARSRPHGLRHRIHVGPGEDAENAGHLGGRGRFNIRYPRVGMIAAAEGDVQRSRGLAIVDKRSLAREKTRVLDALDARTDQLGSNFNRHLNPG